MPPFARAQLPLYGAPYPPPPYQDSNQSVHNYFWRPLSPTAITVNPGQTVPLSPPANYQSAVTMVAEISNTVTVSLGSTDLRIIVVALGNVPNSAFDQLAAGAQGTIYTDDPIHEFFDLGDYYAVHNDPVNAQRLYLTVWTLTGAGGR